MKFLNLFLLFAATSVSAFGQTVDGKQITRVQLITDAVDFSKPFTVGIRFVLEPDWYLYWKNPGDSGLPIEVQWDLPKGWSVSEPQHPVPAKFAYDNMVSYGYKKEVVLLATVIPGTERVDTLNAKVDWLVCKESCVRGKADVFLSLSRNPTRAQAATILADARKRLPGSPRELSLVPSSVRQRQTTQGWEVEVDLTGRDASTVTDFFPEPTNNILIDFSSIRIENQVLRFRLDQQDKASLVREIRGLFIAGARGYQGVIPVYLKFM
ncbi:MAG: protein-disulfide reductase DsbD domain-containing protein, partial [Bacteroidota bacterium]